MSVAIIAAVNDDAVLQRCLLSSPDITRCGVEVKTQRGYAGAAKAYNEGIKTSTAEVLIFVHQDVYFPTGWFVQLKGAIHQLSQIDPSWGVLGVWGIGSSGEEHGHVYCGGVRRILGKSLPGVVEVRSLDEVVLIVRKASGLHFDERLEGFHMYGTDLCLEARRRGMKSYAISAFCIHNTNGYNLLPWEFWRAYFFIRRKWKAELPVRTSCIQITSFCWPIIWWNINRGLHLLLRRHKPGRRVPDPSLLYRELCGQ